MRPSGAIGADRIIRKLENLLWERRLGISTRGVYGSEDGATVTERHYYATVPYRAIFRILDHLSLHDTDVFVDLGCGKGRAICCAARYQIAQVIGVECLDNLCELARRNVQRLHGRRSPASVVNVPAEDFDYSRGTAFYLFNPFGPATMREVLGKLRSGLDARPRVVRIAYVNPMHEEVLAATPWLKCYAMLPDAQLRDFNPTSFWTT